MLDEHQPNISDIDLHLDQAGYFCVLDWLLSRNLLLYDRYESWRGGELKYLADTLPFDHSALNTMLTITANHCVALGLDAEPQALSGWDQRGASELQASSDAQHHQQLTQRWRRRQDSLQMDLFMDNAVLLKVNELVGALAARRFAAAGEMIKELAQLKSAHRHLDGYRRLADYGIHIQAHGEVDEADIEAELEKLQQQLVPLAQDVLGAGARDYLAFAWRRLANSLKQAAFVAERPHLHRSFALAQIPDWSAVEDCLLQEPTLYLHPVLMERLTLALEWLRKYPAAQLLWCLLLERHPEYAEVAVDRQRTQSIYPLWEDFCDLDAELPGEFFAAFVLARQPGLVHQLGELEVGDKVLGDKVPGDKMQLQSPSSMAMLELLQCHQAGRDEVAARAKLQGISPTLLNVYMSLL